MTEAAAGVAVLFEDNHLLAVHKPAGMLVQGDSTGDLSLLDLCKEYRRHREQKPGNVFLGLVHRLDRPVSGVVVFAKNSKAAARLSAQFRERRIVKEYVAAVEIRRALVSESGTWAEALLKDSVANRVVVSRLPSASPAVTRWRSSACTDAFALLRLEPETGRPHQLRVHCSHHGLPILGDRKYGSTVEWKAGIALHAAAISLEHPTLKTLLRIEAPRPKAWSPFLLRYRLEN